MTQTAPQKRQRRLWLTVSEVVGVLALAIAGLNYWDAHRERATAERQAAATARGETAFVMTGTASEDGARVMLQPLNPAQAIQSQRYLFPKAVLDNAMEVSAAHPQIDESWIDGGLRRALDTARASGRGEDEVKVGVMTTYVENGETHLDRSIYRLGYAYRPKFPWGRRITLQGVALGRRNLKVDLQPLLDVRRAPLE